MSPLAKARNSGAQVFVAKAVELQPAEETPKRYGGHASGCHAAGPAILGKERMYVSGADTRPVNRLGAEHGADEVASVSATVEPSCRRQTSDVSEVCIKRCDDSFDVGRERRLFGWNEPPFAEMANQMPQGRAAVGAWVLPTSSTAREPTHVNFREGPDGAVLSPERTEEHLCFTDVPLDGGSTVTAEMKVREKRFEHPELGTGAKPNDDAWTEIRFDHWWLS